MVRAFRAVGLGTLAGAGTFTLWTRQCRMEGLGRDDPVFLRPSFAKFNPSSTPSSEMRDICTRRLSLDEIRPDLLENSRKGGSALVEGFAQGVWGGFGYTPQRFLLNLVLGGLPESENQLWSKQELIENEYEIGTEFTDHGIVVEKDQQSILFRMSDSPRNCPDSPRDMDGLIELRVESDFANKHVDLIFKTVFFAGTGFKGPPGGKFIPGPVDWAHRQYTKLLVEAAVARVRR
ncbi:hypothetical protein LTR84_001466 [Exophiala bonariae]|uniref:Uncharacterized protein n=1 Tax=Exophiala bonariae TaxID=1690606 RepID=A0AAV9NCQ1_9EURO|nr:hypothetical protein LTR84_001466 [Exophiala bonariae]